MKVEVCKGRCNGGTHSGAVYLFIKGIIEGAKHIRQYKFETRYDILYFNHLMKRKELLKMDECVLYVDIGI